METRPTCVGAERGRKRLEASPDPDALGTVRITQRCIQQGEAVRNDQCRTCPLGDAGLRSARPPRGRWHRAAWGEIPPLFGGLGRDKKERGARGRCLNCPTRRSAAGRPPAQVTQTGLPRPDEGAASKTPRSGARPWSRPQTWHKATLKPSGAAQQFHPSWVTGTGIWTVAKCRVDPGSGWREGRSWPWRTGRPPFQGKSHAPWPLSGLKGSLHVNALALFEVQRILLLFDRAQRGQTAFRFRGAPPGH